MSDSTKPETNGAVIQIVVLTLAINATIGVGTLAYCLLMNKDVNVALFTAFVAIVNYMLGVLSGMLIKSSPTASTSAEHPAGTVTVPEQKLETQS